MRVKDVEHLHVRINFNREGVELKSIRRKLLLFRKYFRADVQNLGGGRDAALRALELLTRLYDEAGAASPYVLSLQYPHAQNAISGSKTIELRKSPPSFPYVQGEGARVLISQSASKSKIAPHPGAVFGPKQNGRILGQLSITNFLEIDEEDLTEQLAVDAQVSLAALKAAWRDGYKWGWLLDYPVAFDHPPVTYDHTATEGTRMGTIFTCTKRAPIKRAIRVQKQKND